MRKRRILTAEQKQATQARKLRWRAENPERYSARNTRKNRERRARNPILTKLETRIGHKVSTALRYGQLVKGECFYKKENCSGRIESHHCSYKESEWLKVTWLCARHHRAWHRVFEVEHDKAVIAGDPNYKVWLDIRSRCFSFEAFNKFLGYNQQAARKEGFCMGVDAAFSSDIDECRIKDANGCIMYFKEDREIFIDHVKSKFSDYDASLGKSK